jgi:hypothetical protein
VGAVAFILYRFDHPSAEKLQITPTAGGASVSGRF